MRKSDMLKEAIDALKENIILFTVSSIIIAIVLYVVKVPLLLSFIILFVINPISAILAFTGSNDYGGE